MIIDLDHVQVAMPRGQEAQARAFYGGLLGLRELPKPVPMQTRGGLWFECGGKQLHLGVEDDFRPAGKAHPALLVRGYESLLQALRAADCPVRDDVDQPGVTRAFTEDPSATASSWCVPMENRYRANRARQRRRISPCRP